MKKVVLSVVLLSFVVVVSAQDYTKIKNMVALGQAKKAKEDLDKSMTNAKFTAKPEAYILKATLYATIAMDKDVKGTPEGDLLVKEADAAFAKYKEMQPDLALVKDPIYANGPINLYSALFTSGYKDYEAKNWQKGFETFEKVVTLSDMLIKEKVINVTADTNSLILAGVTAESSNNKEAAAKYYTRLADLKMSSSDYENVYRFLVTYYFSKNDIAAFEKYKAMGKELYPKSEFFGYDKIDFAVGLVDDMDKKIAALENILATDPANYRANLLLGGVIYDTLNNPSETAVLPANADALEIKMVDALNKASNAKPDAETPLIYLGGHFLNKSKRINELRKKHAAEMKARTKPGTASSKEDLQKRDALDQQYGATLDKVIAPYEKAASIFAAKLSTLSIRDKNQYKYIVGDLGEIYGYKKGQAKGKPADLAKFTAEEKKWNDLYDTIK
ncbi:MAG TPA: hypothetical protein VF487_04725 [Chitinophagaceae bacterium]